MPTRRFSAGLPTLRRTRGYRPPPVSPTIEGPESLNLPGEVPVFLGDWLGRRALLTPVKVALIDATRGNRPITYRQWNQAANRSAQLLRTLGAGKGDRVAILAHN